MMTGGVPDLPSPRLRAAAAGRHSPLRLQRPQVIEISILFVRWRRPSTLASTPAIQAGSTSSRPSLPSASSPDSLSFAGMPGPLRALELLTACRDGCTEAPLIRSRTGSVDDIVTLVCAGLATASAERMVVGRRTVEAATVRITEAGRRILAGEQRMTADHSIDQTPLSAEAKIIAEGLWGVLNAFVTSVKAKGHKSPPAAYLTTFILVAREPGLSVEEYAARARALLDKHDEPSPARYWRPQSQRTSRTSVSLSLLDQTLPIADGSNTCSLREGAPWQLNCGWRKNG